jgi:hypothetical protein
MLRVAGLQTNFSSSRSCILDPVSGAFPCTFLKLSFKFLPCCNNLSLFLSGVASSASSDRSSFVSNEMTGMGSSRLTKASTVNSSILMLDLSLRVRFKRLGVDLSVLEPDQSKPHSWRCLCTADRHPLPCGKHKSNAAKESD